jgi:lipoate-protein ligase A
VTGFVLSTTRGSAADFHARVLDPDAAPEVWVFEVARPALVVGSRQRPDVVADVDACAAAGVEVVRRRSGGGAVLLEPGRVVWFDVVVPAAHLHAAGVGDDVGASMAWLGWHVAGALGELGVAGVDVHRGGMACSAWCPLVCFAGIGPGEVLLDGVKLVGISQRRSRPGSRFQCAVHTTWRPDALVGLLRDDVPASGLPTVAVLAPDVAAALPAAVAASLST